MAVKPRKESTTEYSEDAQKNKTKQNKNTENYRAHEDIFSLENMEIPARSQDTSV